MASYIPFDYEELTVGVGAAAQRLTQARVEAADQVVLRCTGGTARFRMDATNPTATVGIPHGEETFSLTKPEGIGFRVILASGETVAHVCRATFYRLA